MTQPGFFDLVYRYAKLGDRSKEANRKRSSVRVRVEYIFDQQESFGNGKYISTIGLARTRLKV